MGPQVHGPPFAEQRVDDVVLRVLDVQGDVEAEFVQHDGGLAGVHIPGNGPAHEAAQERPVQIDPPALQALAPAAQFFHEIHGHARAGIGHGAHARAQQETGAGSLVHEGLDRDEMQTQAQQRTAQVEVRPAGVAQETREERWAAIEGFKDGFGQGHERGADDHVGQQRDGQEGRVQQGGAGQSLSQEEQSQEKGAVHGSLAQSFTEIMGAPVSCGPAALEGVHEQSGQEEGLAPQAGLGHGHGSHGREKAGAGGQTGRGLRRTQVCRQWAQARQGGAPGQQRVGARFAQQTSYAQGIERHGRGGIERAENDHPPAEFQGPRSKDSFEGPQYLLEQVRRLEQQQPVEGKGHGQQAGLGQQGRVSSRAGQ